LPSKIIRCKVGRSEQQGRIDCPASFPNLTNAVGVAFGSISLAAELTAGTGVAPQSVASKVAVIPATNVIQVNKGDTVQDAVLVETPPGWLGVTTRKAKTGGAMVASVAPNGPAVQAGLKIGDTILELNGTLVTDENLDAEIARLARVLANLGSGESLGRGPLNIYAQINKSLR